MINVNASTINFNQTTPDSTAWLELERTSSGIPMSLWKSNITIDGGWELLGILVPDLWDRQRQQTYINASTKRTADRYANVTDSGAWLATGWQPSGIEPVPVIKPQSPRWDSQNQKFIKYETPKGSQALPFFAWVPYSYGLKIAKTQGRRELEAYQKRIGIQDVDAIDYGFWPWAIERNWTTTITEGVKKSLALIAQGVLAVGLRGITQWRVPKTNGLSASLQPFATKGRIWQIALDQDIKPTTRATVRGQVLKLGRAIEKRGTVKILEWSPELGKGIDDLLVAAGEESDKALADIIRNARTLAAYKRDLETNLQAIADLQNFTVQPPAIGDRLATLPELPKDHLMVIDSSMGTGKTYRIINDLIGAAKSVERLTLVIAPNNNLCIQFADSVNFPHIHNYGTRSTDTEALRADIYYRGGVVLCLDSLPRLLAICPGLLNSAPLVIVDEVSQVLTNLATAGTLGKRQPEGVKAFKTLVQSAHAVGIAECGIPQRCIDLIQAAAKGGGGNKFLQSINNIDKADRQELKVITIHHRNQEQAWPVNMYHGHQDSAFLGALIAAVEQGGTHYFATTSKTKAKQLKSILTEAFPDKNILRIDSETTEGGVYDELFRTPDSWLRKHKPDVLITTTIMQSGISIDGGKSPEESYFSDVWGHFPSLTPKLHMQQIARVRPAVQRHIWIPETIQRTPEESSAKPWGLLSFWQQHANAQAGFHNLEQPSELEKFELAIQKFCAESMVQAGLEKSIAFEYLKHLLEEDGHKVNVVDCESDKTVAQEFMRARQQLESAEAEAIAAVLIDPEVDTVAWASEELSSTSSTVKTRRKANKILARQRFPDVLFDDLDTALSLVTRYGALAKAAELRAGAENPAAERIMERVAVVELLSASTRGYHLLPKRGNRAQILADIGILDLIDYGEEYSRDSEIVQRIAAQAIKYAPAIWQFFSLNIHEGQDLVGICHRLLKRLGYEVNLDDRPGAIIRTSRTGLPGNQVQNYQIVKHPSEVYERLLMASRAKRGLLAAISKGSTDPSRDDCKEDETDASPAFEADVSRLIPFDAGADKEDADDFEEDYLAEAEDGGFD